MYVFFLLGKLRFLLGALQPRLRAQLLKQLTHEHTHDIIYVLTFYDRIHPPIEGMWRLPFINVLVHF